DYDFPDRDAPGRISAGLASTRSAFTFSGEFMSQATKLLVVDDHAVLREGLRFLLQTQPDFAVVGEACDGREAIKMMHELSSDVGVMGVCMPNLNVDEATRQVIAARPHIKVIALSALTDERFAVQMLKAGAKGFVAKVSAFTELVNAIRTVLKNQMYFPP